MGGVLQLPVIPVPEDLMPMASEGMCTHVPIPTCRHNTHKIKDSKNTLKKESGGKKEVLSHIRKLTPKNI